MPKGTKYEVNSSPPVKITEPLTEPCPNRGSKVDRRKGMLIERNSVPSAKVARSPGVPAPKLLLVVTPGASGTRKMLIVPVVYSVTTEGSPGPVNGSVTTRSEEHTSE